MDVKELLDSGELDGDCLKDLLDCAAELRGIGERAELISGKFLGAPYMTGPLVGSAEQAEELSIQLDGFDCVTFVETVLSLSSSDTAEGFLQRLIDLRYANGKIEWLDRNHYSTDWIENNAGKGLVQNITPIELVYRVTRTLSCLKDYPPRERELCYLPVDQIAAASPGWQTGDVIFFGSTRSDLDVAHMGLLVCKGATAQLRHATKSKGAVIDEPLSDFMLRFGESPGVMVARPL